MFAVIVYSPQRLHIIRTMKVIAVNVSDIVDSTVSLVYKLAEGGKPIKKHMKHDKPFKLSMFHEITIILGWPFAESWHN